MNRFAYRTTGLAIKALAGLSRARTHLHSQENIPRGSLIFVVNHFTRIETLLMPYLLHRLTGVPIWSLASERLFNGSLKNFLDRVGAISTRNPKRDELIVKTLLTGEAAWVIYPEGRMVKSKKIVEKGRYVISYAGGKRAPHTGAATLALRTEFYRQRLRALQSTNPQEAERLKAVFKIDDLEPVFNGRTFIVPVNLTYYPIRARENILTQLAQRIREDIPDRLIEELMTEGTMLLSGVDIDLRFGKPIEIKHCLKCHRISRDIETPDRFGFDDVIASRIRMRREALRIMKRYMDAIYRLTTVNHDHLFASILRMMPYGRIPEMDLRRRVYLAVGLCARDRGCCLHRSLEEDQLHLLTDDRYGKFRDFVDLAVQKGVLARDGDVLVKNKPLMKAPFEFHRVRLDNPIGVIANEVEPLTATLRCLRRLSWTPSSFVRRRIARFLMKKAVEDYEADFKAYFKEGESKDRSVGMPFLLKGRRRRLGVVLVHGYMAAPMEVRGLADYLHQQGFWVYAPRVKGHGTSPEDLARRGHEEWIRSVEEGYALMSCLCRRVVIGGFSNGAGLALELASRIPEAAGVFAVSPPFRLQDFSARFAPALHFWNRVMDRVHRDNAKMEFVENRPEHPHINYLRNPISGVRELDRLMERVEDRLRFVDIPALVIQSEADPVVLPEGTRKVFRQLGTRDKTYITFNFDRHGILLGQGADRVYRAVADFLKHLETIEKIKPDRKSKDSRKLEAPGESSEQREAESKKG
ncbi:MAG: alpha/beta fold hydrolase [Desulfobacterales bacterium]